MLSESTETDVDKTLDTVRDHAWDYFELHAEQRMKTFHFYILLETGLVGAMLVSARIGTANTWLFAVIGFFMAMLSFIFFKLDERTKGMIKVAEDSLKACEARMGQRLAFDMSSTLPFTNEPQAKGLVGKSFRGVVSYSTSFRTIFWAFGALGISVAFLLIFVIPAR